MREKVFLGLLALFLAFNIQAQNSRSDSIDVLNYQINLDFTDFGSSIIKGNCQLIFSAKINGITELPLDLLKLTIDSITSNGAKLTYSYNDTLIRASLSTTLNIGDRDTVLVYYHGIPQKDATWGGFYFDNSYAYNMGVGFDSDPHNFGRVWFPCFDNFVERSTYDFNMTTSGGKKAHCNGELISESTISGDTLMRSWKLEEEIPTYLVCVAVSDYETIHQSYQGDLRSIPVELVAREADTLKLKDSFVHLSDALNIYEDHYGPYLWNKIGFSVVPFSSGAMEHATNVAYPRNAVDGTTNRETLMAHEFAHHWWGNLVTCETAGDMWINEGMASFSEHLFLEDFYGRQEYIDAVKDNHRNILQFAHLRDDSYLALSNMPHDYTYGSHTYNKGASVAHNMRAYMGDSLFFKGLQSIVDSFQFKTVNASQFRDQLNLSSGLDLTDFFDNWIFASGYSHFAIDSSIISTNGSDFDVHLYIQQKLKGAVDFHQNTPIEISFYDSNWNKQIETIIISGQIDDTIVTLPFDPILIILNEANLLNQARTDDQMIISSTGSQTLNSSMSDLTVNAVTDSVLLQIEHHWVAPDPIRNNINNYRISTTHYWSIDGIINTSFDASLSIDYGNKTGSGQLDGDLIKTRGDSLILLYRKNAFEDWVEYSPYTKSSRFPSSTSGTMIIDSLILGEYAFANGVTIVGVEEEKDNKSLINIYPNPAEDLLWIEHEVRTEELKIEVYDMLGREVFTSSFTGKIGVNTSSWESGSYSLIIKNNQDPIFRKKVVIN